MSDKPFYLSWRPPVSQAEIDSSRTSTLRTLMSVDDMVDRVLRELQATGELDNTLVIYTSDNGYHWGEHRYFGKFTPHLPSIDVPMFLRWPGKVTAGSHSSSLVTNVDIAPTDPGGRRRHPDGPALDGRSLLSTRPPRDRLFIEYMFDPANGPTSPPTWSATLTPGYEYVENIRGTTRPSFREYYNLTSDPWQLTNLYSNGTTADDPPVAPLAGWQPTGPARERPAPSPSRTAPPAGVEPGWTTADPPGDASEPSGAANPDTVIRASACSTASPTAAHTDPTGVAPASRGAVTRPSTAVRTSHAVIAPGGRPSRYPPWPPRRPSSSPAPANVVRTPDRNR